jgi:hypothetical protein
VLVPAVSSRYTSLHRQWDYIFGFGEEAAYVEVPRVKSKAKLVMGPAVDDSPAISAILFDHAKELSRNPKKEAVILVAHGPEEPEYNVPDLARLTKHAEWIRRKSVFAEVLAINVQDDAIKPIRAANVKKLRQMIAGAQAQGREVLVVPAVLASHGIQAALREDMRGLTYRFQEKGMSAHPKFSQWVLGGVSAALAAADRSSGRRS